MEETKSDSPDNSHSADTKAAYLGCAAIAIIFLLVFGGVAWALYHLGAIDKIKTALSNSRKAKEQQAARDEIEKQLAMQERMERAKQESQIAQALRDFVAAQKIHQRDFGAYAAQPEGLMGIGAVEDDTGAATSPDSAFHGYYFFGLENYAQGYVNLDEDFVFVAVPAEYGETGRYTYAIGPASKVLKKDIGSEVIDNVSQITRWEQVK